MDSCPCNEYPLIPNFYIVKMGFKGVNIFLIFAAKVKVVGTTTI